MSNWGRFTDAWHFGIDKVLPDLDAEKRNELGNEVLESMFEIAVRHGEQNAGEDYEIMLEAERRKATQARKVTLALIEWLASDADDEKWEALQARVEEWKVAFAENGDDEE